MGWSVPNWRSMVEFTSSPVPFQDDPWWPHYYPLLKKWLLGSRPLVARHHGCHQLGTRGITQPTQQWILSPFLEDTTWSYNIIPWFCMFLWSWIEKSSVRIINQKSPSIWFCPEMPSNLVMNQQLVDGKWFTHVHTSLDKLLATEKKRLCQWKGDLSTKSRI